jgi:DNA-binding winged helix-turn-helix (wHTH) protein
VDVHVRRLRAKLGAENEALIGTVRNVGYRFVPVKSGGAAAGDLAGEPGMPDDSASEDLAEHSRRDVIASLNEDDASREAASRDGQPAGRGAAEARPVAHADY